MAENSSTLLTFVRTNDEGDLTLRNPLTNETYVIEVSDELEQGILAAKQIKKDAQGAPLPQNEKALPISLIQSLIRAGQTPEEIQHEHGVSAALVRRFAGPVETEKKFAISQFLDTVVPSDQNASKVTEIIQTTMAAIGSDFEEVEWDASREDHNPWRIVATYDARENTETAQWTFNPRDHSVVCVNTPAKRLLGEIALTTSPVDKSLFSTDAVPIVVSSDAPRTDAQGAVSMRTGSFDSVSMTSMRSNTRMSTGAFNAIVDNDSETARTDLDTEHSEQPQSFEPHLKRENVPSSENQSSDDNLTTQSDASINNDSQEKTEATHKTSSTAKRMRSSIPAWDDILFGSN